MVRRMSVVRMALVLSVAALLAERPHRSGRTWC